MKTSKFNRSEILKKAWSLVRRNGYTLSNALKAAWQYARNNALAPSFTYKGDAEMIFTSPSRRFNAAGLNALSASLNRGI